MSTILAALLAISLSSTDIDEFFTLPSWHENEADSYNTPGSDPAIGEEGWYVHEYTNSISFSAWRWKLDGNWTHADQQWMMYQGDGVWNIGSIAAQMISEAGGRIVPTDCTIHVLIPQTIQGEEDATNLTWTTTCVYQRNGSQEYSSTNLYIEAIRDKTVTPVPTGKCKPRAARLTPEVQAGVLSTFAGMLERQYYSMQGQTNGWEQGEKWPEINKRIFSFAPDAHETITYYTNTSWYVTATVDEEMFFLGEVNIRTRTLQNKLFWHIYPELVTKVCQLVGGWYVYSCDPEYIQGNIGDLTLSSPVRLGYYDHSGTNICYTNFTFEASRIRPFIRTNETITAGEYLYIPSNRIIRTRRLSDYDNINRLADFMTKLSNNGFKGKTCDRWSTNIVITVETNAAGVVEAVTNYFPVLTWFGNSDPDDVFMWSSTEDNIFTGTRILPTITSSRNPTTPFFLAWKDCSQTFACLDYDDVWYRIYYSYNSRQTLTEKLMEDINLGVDIYPDPIPPPYDATVCRPVLIEARMKDLIETNFPHADGWAITNDTRRLKSDRLCCINQALSLMDRTYHVPKIVYTNVVTNLSCESHCYYHGNLRVESCTVDWNVVNLHLCESEIKWGSPIITNKPVESSSSPCENDVLVFRFNGTSSGVEFKATQTVFDAISTNPDMLMVAIDDIKSMGYGDGDYTIDLYLESPSFFSYEGGGIGVSIQMYWNLNYTNEGFRSISSNLGKIDNVKFTMDYSRYGRYMRPVAPPRIGKTQPGWQGSASASYGYAFSRHTKKEELGPLSKLVIDSTSSIRYDTGDGGTYSSHNDLMRKVEDIYYSGVKGRFTDSIGFDPEEDGWRCLIIDMNDVIKVRDSFDITSCAFTYTGTGWYTRAIVSIKDGEATILDVTSFNASGGSYPGYITIALPVLLFEEEHDQPEQKSVEPCSMNAKLGIITRTDWKWKTLKRDDD